MFPPCKINLGLYVGEKRADGYHELESIMYQLPLTDILEVIPAGEFSFRSSGLEIPGEEKHNLCVKAYELMKREYSIPPVAIHLHKQIPMGAGLGGGSADGTYTILLINRIFDLELTEERMRTLALELGSDCPLFVSKDVQLARGRGEVLNPLELSLDGYWVQLINTGIHISTGEAFGALSTRREAPDWKEVVNSPFSSWKKELENAFEVGAFQKHPVLAQVKKDLYASGASYVSMTGTGSTIYAIFEKEPENPLRTQESMLNQLFKI